MAVIGIKMTLVNVTVIHGDNNDGWVMMIMIVMNEYVNMFVILPNEGSVWEVECPGENVKNCTVGWQ